MFDGQQGIDLVGGDGPGNNKPHVLYLIFYTIWAQIQSFF